MLDALFALGVHKLCPSQSNKGRNRMAWDLATWKVTQEHPLEQGNITIAAILYCYHTGRINSEHASHEVGLYNMVRLCILSCIPFFINCILSIHGVFKPDVLFRLTVHISLNITPCCRKKPSNTTLWLFFYTWFFGQNFMYVIVDNRVKI